MSQTATFYAAGDTTDSIDSVTPTHAYPGSINVGPLYGGGSKLAIRRALMKFDLRATPSEGRLLRADDTLVDAQLILDIAQLPGPGSFSCQLDRISRAEWNPAVAEWTDYDTALAWTTQGGDVATPPAALAYGAPNALGDFVIAGLLGWVADAIANRGGVLHTRQMAVDESYANTHYYAAWPATSRLVVSYRPKDPTPIAEPGSVTRGTRPAARGAATASASRPAGAAQPGRAHGR
jgi:hypothetical protein